MLKNKPDRAGLARLITTATTIVVVVFITGDLQVKPHARVSTYPGAMHVYPHSRAGYTHAFNTWDGSSSTRSPYSTTTPSVRLSWPN